MLVWVLGLALTAAAPASCPDESGAPKKVKPAALKVLQQQVKQAMGRKGVHALDFPVRLRPKVSVLGATPGAELCAQLDDARTLLDAVRDVVLGEEFVLKKRGRVQGYSESPEMEPARADKARRQVSDASAALVNGKYGRANQLLNQALVTLFDKTELWSVPEKLPEPAAVTGEAGPAAPVVNDGEASEECPAIMKRGSASAEEFGDTVARLGKTFDERHVRLLDLKDGEALWKQVMSEQASGGLFAATRDACGLQHRARTAEIDVGFVSKRFQVVRSRHAEKATTNEARFAELVNAATEHIAASRFAEAHTALEELLVMLGEPKKASAGLR